jgi:MoxR-like ATPase
MTTKSQTQAADVACLLRARNSVLWVNSAEETRVELYLAQACASAGYNPTFWDCAAGLTDLSGKLVAGAETRDASTALDYIRDRARQGAGRDVYIMRDLHKWLEGAIGIQTLRQLRNLSRELPPLGTSIIVLAPSNAVPPELAGGDVVVLDWPLPDRDEIGAILDTAMKNGGAKVEPLNGNRDAAIDAAIGLSGLEAEASFAKSLVQSRRIDPALVAAEKKRVIARGRVLEWMEPLVGGFDAVGGLDVLKTWTRGRVIAYTPRARAYGLKPLRGIFLAGISGCGKTYTAKALAWELGRVPLLRADLGSLKSKYVGESEANLRKLFQTADSVGRCVILIDEIEKALAGATQGAADGGVSSDALGALLTWMQERTNEAFVVATANDVSQLPPELLRKGRWDELFFVDLPNPIERAQIIEAATRTNGRDPAALFGADGADEIAARCPGFTGAELAALVPEAMFAAFRDGEREINPGDLIEAARNVVPLSETSKEKISAMRAWAKGRARPATTPETTQEAATGRALDL